MNKILSAYLSDLPLGRGVATWGVWCELCKKYQPSTVLRHKAQILAILRRAEEAYS